MVVLVVIIAILVVCFGGVLLFGAPYLPTLSPQVAAALELADLQPGQSLIELGCGDGKVLIAAAKQGATVVGYELNPILAGVAWVRTRRYGKRVSVICGNFWSCDWPQADIIFTFLLPKYMERLNTRIVQGTSHPVKLVSFAFKIPGKRPAATKAGVFLYSYK